MDRIFSFVTKKRALLFGRFSLALMLIWFGFVNFDGVGEGVVTNWLKGHAFLSGLSDHGDEYANYLGLFQVLCGLLLLVPHTKAPLFGAIGAAGMALGSLTLLFLAPVWLDALGGFPAIGAGQGIIKYVAIFGVAMFVASQLWAGGADPRCVKAKTLALKIILFGIVLVMLWIGAMKFTLPEAQGIDPLLKTSPFFSWIPKLFDIQGASNFIGAIEIVAALSLLGWLFNPVLFRIGAALCIITFLGTLSFMLTLPGWDPAAGFPMLSRAGIFLLKDLILLAGTGLLIAHSGFKKS